MVRVNICCNLENKSGKLGILRVYHTFHSLHGTWTWSNLHKTVEQFLNSEVIECRTKEYRSYLCVKIILYIELRVYSINEFKVGTQFECKVLADIPVEFLTVNVHLDFLGHALLVGCKKVKFLLIDIIHTLETCTLVYGPAEWAHCYLQFAFEFIEQFKRVTTFAVHLVHVDNYGSVAHTAHLHELTGLGLHTLGTVNNNDYTVHSRKCAECILGKVLVTRSIEDIYLVAIIIELHDRGCNRDTTLFLNLHPVRCGCFLYLVRLHRTGNLNLTTEKQQFLGQRSLSGIRVRNDCKCSSSSYLFLYTHCIAVLSFISYINSSSRSSLPSSSSLK